MESGDTNACPSAPHTSTTCQASKSSKKAQLKGPTGKLLVELWSIGEIVGANASQFKTAIGEAVRHHVPLSTKDYRKLKGNFKEDIWTDLTKNMNLMWETMPLVHLSRKIILKSLGHGKWICGITFWGKLRALKKLGQIAHQM